MKEFSILLCLLLSATLTQAQTGETKKPAPAKAAPANSEASAGSKN